MLNLSTDEIIRRIRSGDAILIDRETLRLNLQILKDAIEPYWNDDKEAMAQTAIFNIEVAAHFIYE